MRVLPSFLKVSVAAFAAVFVLGSLGCAHEISSEERLERETKLVPLDEAKGASELEKINCQETAALLGKARNVNRPETDRVKDYIELYTDLRKKTQAFEEAMSRNPDLQYREGAQKYADAKDVCVQQTADVRVEFERYVRDLVDLPTVQELKGGNTVTVARLDFATLRDAIETLSPDDKDMLLSRVTTAEKKIEAAAKSEPERRRKR